MERTRFELLVLFLRGHAELGRIHDFSVLEIADEETVGEFIRSLPITDATSSPSAPESPSSEEEEVQCL